MDFMIDLILDQWENKIIETTEVFGSIGAQNAMQPVAPGKNRVIYLLGHLIAVHDRLFEALNLNERRYPEYDEMFLTPQHPSNQYPAYELLLEQWISTNETLLPGLRLLTVQDWQSKHHYVSDYDFNLNPKRNKFSVFLSRNAHLFHHSGQLALIRTDK